MEEIWKDIKGYEGLYQVSNKGQIKSTERFGTKGGILKGSLRGGYHRVILTKQNKSRHYSVHRLVAETFIPNAENKKSIDHIDTDRLNNSVDNLRWVTDKENANNPKTKEKMRKKIATEETRKKLSLAMKQRETKTQTMHKAQEKAALVHQKRVKCLDTGIEYKSAREASQQTGIRWKDISIVCTGRRKSCKHTHWQFV